MVKQLLHREEAIAFLKQLGVPSYTNRTLKIINEFIKNEDTNLKKLLDRLGKWDGRDLVNAENFFKKWN